MTDIDPHAPGAKLDQGKPWVDAIWSGFPRAQLAVAEVGTFGAKKYSLNGWQSVDDALRRYADAGARHRLLRQMGETHDPESGLPHIYHEAWNMMAVLELTIRED